MLNVESNALNQYQAAKIGKLRYFFVLLRPYG